MIDRFGLLPEPVKNLFRVTAIKILAQQVGISKIEVSERGGKLEFSDDTRVEPLSLVQLVQTQPARYQLAGATALKFSETLDDREQRFVFVEQLIGLLTPS
jgi:transcription-repair coupling factor (superfamily II helicase)